jgi:hypothetical protein
VSVRYVSEDELVLFLDLPRKGGQQFR